MKQILLMIAVVSLVGGCGESKAPEVVQNSAETEIAIEYEIRKIVGGPLFPRILNELQSGPTIQREKRIARLLEVDAILASKIMEELGERKQNIPDRLVKEAVVKLLRSDAVPLSKADYNKVTVIRLPNINITDVSPIGRLTQLRELQLNKNQISDLTPLKGLKQLEWLILDENKIIDVSPLKELKQLRELSIRQNHVRDVSALKELKYLDLEWMGRSLTFAEVEKLREALPYCEIRDTAYRIHRRGP